MARRRATETKKARIATFLQELDAGGDIRFSRLLTICETVFGPGRARGSHHIFPTPWPGNPRVNLQPSKGGKAKGYQVRQVVAALLNLLESDSYEEAPPKDR